MAGDGKKIREGLDIGRKTARRIRIGGAAALLALILGGITLVLLGEFDSKMMMGLVCGDGMAGFGAVIVLLIMHSFIPFPAELVALAAGDCLGFWPGLTAVWIGAMIGALLAFWLARRLGREFVEASLGERSRAALDRWTADKGAATLLICRLIPVIAFNLINYAAGLTEVRLWTFVWTTGLGILPITALTTAVGASMRTIPTPVLLGLCVAGVAMVLLGRLAARRLGWIGGRE
jgi:uncharacterized membrane protein YdjX (TVP38/TMEM64 family)